jgi:hypothetical protein
VLGFSTPEGLLIVTVDTQSPADTTGSGDAQPVQGMASGGRKVTMSQPAPLPTWPQPRNADEVYVPEEEFDITDLSEVNRQLQMAKSRLFRISQHLKSAQRAEIDATLTYRRAFRRLLVGTTGGSAETRKAMAEVMCEEFENDMVIATQVVDEWKKRAQDARDDLKAIENLAHNVRAQMAIQ